MVVTVPIASMLPSFDTSMQDTCVDQREMGMLPIAATFGCGPRLPEAACYCKKQGCNTHPATLRNKRVLCPLLSHHHCCARYPECPGTTGAQAA